MSASKHTPGPWFLADWDEDDGPNRVVIEARAPEVLFPGQSSIWPGGIRCMQIASVRDSSVDAEATAANARLIAAAPELLEALTGATAALEELRRGHGPAVSSLCFPPLNLARAAIAKATGATA